MDRRIRRIVLTAAVLPLVMLIGLRAAWASYACTIDGDVRSACCCPQKSTQAQEPSDGAPRMQANCCCDVTMGESSAPPDARLGESSRVSDMPFVLTMTVPEVAPPTAWTAATVTASARPPPPRRSLPTYLANRTILR